MQILETGGKELRTFNPSEVGFTLVEVLIVVFILGLSAGVIVMALPEGSGTLQEDAAHLQRDVNALADQAVLTGVPHGIEFTGDEYKGVLWKDGAWVSLSDFERELSRNVSVRTDDLENRDETPRMVFDPSGAPTQGMIVLAARGERVEISVTRSAVELNR